MLTQTTMRRVHQEIVAAARSGDDPQATQRHVAHTLQGAIGFDQWSWTSADPLSGLGLTGTGDHGYWGSLAELVLLEQRVDGLARSPAEVAGEWGVSWRRTLEPTGFVDEIRRQIRDPRGVWGTLDLVRSDGQVAFSARDHELMRSLEPALAAVGRRLICGPPLVSTRFGDGPSGVVLLDAELRVRSATAEGRTWLSQMPMHAGEEAAPPPVMNVASRVWARRQGFTPAGPARVRVRSIHGTWMLIQAASFDDPATDTVAVTISEATPRQVLDLRLHAHELTAREEQIARLLLQGRDTRSLTGLLGISANTVQDHLKSMFPKLGVDSRRQLIAYLAGDLG